MNISLSPYQTWNLKEAREIRESGEKGRELTTQNDRIERDDRYQFGLEKGSDLPLEGWSLEEGT